MLDETEYVKSKRQLIVKQHKAAVGDWGCMHHGVKSEGWLVTYPPGELETR